MSAYHAQVLRQISENVSLVTQLKVVLYNTNFSTLLITLCSDS